jgi:hypothetical protein
MIPASTLPQRSSSSVLSGAGVPFMQRRGPRSE